MMSTSTVNRVESSRRFVKNVFLPARISATVRYVSTSTRATVTVIIVERDKEVGVTRVYVDKVKFKHLGVGGMASFVYDPVSGRYLPCEESHDPSLSADQRVRNTMFDNSCWLPEKELF